MVTVENDLVTAIKQQQERLKEIQTATKNMETRAKMVSSVPAVSNAGDLRANLESILPKHLVPTNVGHLNKVAWPFWYTFNFDLGAAPVISVNLRKTEKFQVSQEACFIFMSLCRHADDYDVGGDLGPLQIEIRDAQSSRYFNNAPIPIQMIGQKSWPTILPTGMLILPNAIMEMTMSSWLTGTATQTGGGTGKHSFTMGGVRCRVEDASNVMSTIFGR